MHAWGKNVSPLFCAAFAAASCLTTHLPYGVDLAADGKTLIPSVRDKQLIARIKRLHRGGIHVRQIATKVTAEGYRSRQRRAGQQKHGGAATTGRGW